jgi:hypothetical protein
MCLVLPRVSLLILFGRIRHPQKSSSSHDSWFNSGFSAKQTSI